MAHQSNNSFDDISPFQCRCQKQTCCHCKLALVINEFFNKLKFVNGKNGQQSFDLKDKPFIKTLIFYCDLFFKKSQISDFQLDQLYSHNQKATPEVKNIVKNTKDLKEFFSKYEQIFNLNGDKISLKNPKLFHESRLKWIQILLQNDHPGVIRSFVNAIQFYSDILYEKKVNFPIVQLVTHRNKAKEEVQIIATNPVELKSFLAAYPQIFIVSEDKVRLTDVAMYHKSDCSWLKELIYYESPEKQALQKKAIEYYLYILLKAEPENELSIAQLFGFQKITSGVIQEFIKSPEELKNFLSNYPNFFSIKKKKVRIADCLLQSCKREEKVLIKDKSLVRHSAEEKKVSEEDLLKTKLDKCLQNIKKAMQSSCFLEVPLVELMGEIDTFVIKNENELKGFLSNFPNDFFIQDNKVILKEFKILASSEVQKVTDNEEYLKSLYGSNSNQINATKSDITLEGASKICKSKLDEVFKFCLWVLWEKVGVGIEFPIVRLKTYMDLAPFETGICNLLKLKQFLCTFPDFFLITNNILILKRSVDENYVLECKKDIDKYIKYETLFYVESYSTSEAIAFYSRILKRFCFNLEVPISHLFGYRSLAPVEVIALAKDPNELRKFLSAHPDIFLTREDKVCLSRFHTNKECDSEFKDDKDKTAIQFYTSILNKVCHNSEFPIVTLFGYQHLAPLEVKNLVKTPLELKAFLSKYPNLFSVKKDIIIFEKPDLENKDAPCVGPNIVKFQEANPIEQHLLQSTKNIDISSSSNINLSGMSDDCLKSRKSAIISAIRFYSNIMFKKGPNSEHLISSLISYRSEATIDIKDIAKRPIDLKAFLSKFPQVFSVNNIKLTVMLADMVTFYKNQRNWIKELLPKYHQSTTNHELVVNSINFFSSIICEKSPEFELSIKTLFSYRKTAMEDVQTSIKNVFDLKNFLSMYPEIFILNNERVALTDAAISQKNQPKWIEQIVSESDLSDQDNFNVSIQNEMSNKGVPDCNSLSVGEKEVEVIEDIKTIKTIDFFKSILETAGKNHKFSYGNLFEYRCLAPQEIKELIKTPSQLKDFFLQHSNFFVVENKNVILVRSKNKQKNYVQEQQKVNCDKIVNSSNPNEIVKDIASNNKNSAPICQMNDKTISESKNTQISAMKNPKYKPINTILFYTNVMCRKGAHLEYPIANLIGYLTTAPKDVKETIKNPKELKAFLSKFPQVFTVDNDKLTVTLANLCLYQQNRHNWIKELFPRQVFTEVVLNTIQFYSDIIIEKRSDNGLQLNYLFSRRTQAQDDVKTKTNNITELESFLSTFPEIFRLTDTGVFLTASAISHKTQPKWIKQLVVDDEISVEGLQTELKNSAEEIKEVNSQELLKKKKTAIRRAIQFYCKIISNNVSNQGLSLGTLLNEAPSDVIEIAENVTQLNAFLSKYPHIFTINGGMVFLTTFNN